MNFEDNIPINKLIVNLQNDSQNPQVILLTCGNYYPIHEFHIEIFEIAKKYLEEKNNYKIVLGYISPSSERKVNKKYPDKTISFNDRIEMIQKMTNKSSWIDITTWESLSPETKIDIPDYHQIIKNLSDFLDINDQVKQALNGRKLKIIYLFGLDEALKEERNGLNDLDGYEIAIIERYINSESKKENCEKYCKDKLKEMYKDIWEILKHQIIFINCDDNFEKSSRKVRELLKNNDEKWEDLCHPEVVKYIKENKIKF
ncbi:38148_t:CDS:1 [Gigaspora margarita]|uniref:38148_t:CDS:1 n=1 Tax=Gigaspora margarita TaxID=4874 RepID=A0ABM8VXC8_GIGMA|nr:38148_t:CDS:1 [Gigaspora margarita]